MQKNSKNVDSKVLKAKIDKTMLSSNCAIYGGRKSRFMKEQEAKELFSSSGIKTPLSNIPLLSILF